MKIARIPHHKLMTALGLCLLLAAPRVRGQNAFTDGNFETGTAGTPPQNPWSVSAPSGQGTVLTYAGGSLYGNAFPVGTKSVQLTDAASDSSATPMLSQVFPTQTAGPLTLNFDFRVDGTLQDSAWSIDIRPANNAAAHIRFLVDRAGNYFQVQNGAGLISVVKLTPNTWYNVRAHIDLLNKTYSGTITPYSGVASSWTDAAFGTPNADVGRIVISDGVPGATASPLRIDNFSLTPRKGATDGFAEGLVADDFDDYLAGAITAPPVPWSATGSGITYSLDSTSESPFIANTVSGKGLVITDTSITGGASAGFEQRFLPPPAADPLLISFDFRITSMGNNDLSPTFRLSDASGTAGIFLHLWSGGQLVNIGPNSTLANLQSIALDTWYHAVVTTAPLSSTADTYTLKLTPFGGTTVTYTNLPFRVNLNNAGKIAFAHNSNGAGTGQWTIDNVIMAGVVDQPRSAAWPFVQPSIESLRASPKKVFAHWFSSYPVLINYDGDPGRDYFNRAYLNPAGENGKYASVGGLLRDRPLPRLATSQAPTSQETLERSIDEDIRVAARLGIDGFTLNIMATTGYHWNRVVTMLDRAAIVDPGFKIMLQPDMSALTSSDTQAIDAIRSLASKPSAYR